MGGKGGKPKFTYPQSMRQEEPQATKITKIHELPSR